MKNKLISIIIGVVLIIGIGTLVSSTKSPMVLPVENNTSNMAVNSNSKNNNPSTQLKTNTQTSTTKFNFDEDDDSEDSDDIVKTSGGTTTTVVTPQPTVQPGTSGGITLSQIAKHNSSTSCWSAINGSVYDLTSWIPNHPGGEQAILSMCGIDGSNAYNNQHGGSSKPARILGGFKIGTLSK